MAVAATLAVYSLPVLSGAALPNILLAATEPTTGRAMPAESPADPVADPAATVRLGDPPTGVPAAQGRSQAHADVADSLALCR